MRELPMRKLPLREKLLNGLLFVIAIPVLGWGAFGLLMGALWLFGLS